MVAQYKLGKDTTITADLNGDAEATAFAQVWCNRMNYLNRRWLDQPDAKYKVTQADVNGWVQPAAYVAAKAACNKEQLKFLGARFDKKPA